MTIQRYLLPFLAAVMIAAAQPGNSDAALGAARHLEEAEGNYPAAIEAYKRFLAQYGKDRALAAKALVRMGQCYEKLGDAESRKIYERVVRDYADQKEAVAAARARLGGDSSTKNAGIVMRQVWTGPKVDVYGTISPDGRYLSVVDWSTGDLALHDLKTGEDRRLTNKPKGVREHAEWSAISRDGKLVAYSWFLGQLGSDSRYQVRLADLHGDPNPRVLFDNKEVVEISPYDWSPDGKWLAVGVQRKDHTAQIALLPTAGGPLRVLKSVDWRGSGKMFFSPDGAYVAYDLPSSDAPSLRDIFVMSVDGSREIPAVVDPNQDLLLGWSPDGGQILFASDRTGAIGLWSLPFRVGKPAGSARLVKPDIGSFETSMGLSASGALYLGITGTNRDIALASADWTRGVVTAPSIITASRSVGSNADANWSPDGRQLAYNSSRGLTILSVDSGRHRELPLKLSRFNKPRWSPDGHSLLVQGTDLKGRNGFFRADSESGDVEMLAPTASGGNPVSGGNAEWSRDGKKVYLTQADRGPENGGAQFAIFERELESGKERRLVSLPVAGFSFVSPDGRWIATAGRDPVNNARFAMIIPTDGGESRELVRQQGDEQLGVYGWTPDGQSLIVSKTPTGKATEFWMIPIGGKPTTRLAFELNGLQIEPGLPFRFDAGGRRVAITVRGPSRSAVTVVENFLSK